MDYSKFLIHYIKSKNKGLSFANLLQNKNMNNIVIYGAGILGKFFYEDIKERINVICFLDKNAKTTNFVGVTELRVVEPERVVEINNADAIIVTPYTEFYQIRKLLKVYTDAKIISVRDLLGEIQSEDEFIKMSNFLVSKGVSLHFFNRPSVDVIDNPTYIEQVLMFSTSNDCLDKQYKYFEECIYNDIENFSKWYLKELFEIDIYIENSFEHRVKDTFGKYFNIINGHRFIPELPEKYENSVYIFGDCSGLGVYADDERALPNQLQIIINKSKLNYGVVSHSSMIFDILPFFNIIKSLNLKCNDIIIFIGISFLTENHNYHFFKDLDNIFEYDLTPAFSRPHNYGEIFFDNKHIANRGYNLMAKSIYKDIFNNIDQIKNIENPSLEELTSNVERTKNYIEKSSKLEVYLNFLKNEKISIEGKIGAIVVNANPFTLGHLYLIETAAKLVDFLYVFVVEEDKSIFKFKERIELVTKGVRHIDNVKVVRSGQFIISAITFADYFNKDKLSDAKIDASTDIEIFATQIAPVLDISIRFAGTEPFCKVTRQYNKEMCNTLPRFGIKFMEFERLEIDNTQISASEIRTLLRNGNINMIKQLVPKVTYEFLDKNKNDLLSRFEKN